MHQVQAVVSLRGVSTSIPLRVPPLVVVILGLIGTAGGAIAGVVITQRRSRARPGSVGARAMDSGGRRPNV
jgi:hypothetical protein